MTYPYTHTNRAQGRDQIELHKLGTDDGTPLSCEVANVTGGYTENINLPYNKWQIGVLVWATGNTSNVALKVKPWVDHAQSIAGNALALSPYGASTSATVITLAATATGASGVAAQMLSGTGALATLSGGLIASHGIQVIVTTGDDTGTFDAELICIPEA